MEKQNYTCPNPSCGKTFEKPLRVENLILGSVKVYEGCPYCLTELKLEGNVEKQSTEPEQKPKRKRVKAIEVQPSEPHGCAHYFGYLSERSAKDRLPEECMVCPKIVQCMLKGVTG